MCVESFPRYIKAMYNGCLNRGFFPVRCIRTKMVIITKPGKYNSEDVSTFRPISLINTGGKVLEKIFINRIKRHVFSHIYMNKNQYGYTPQETRPMRP